MKHLANTLILSAFLFLVGRADSFETRRVEMREGTENDGQVAIFRQGGELLFADHLTSDPITLTELATRATSHGALTGLEEDDHPHYLDDTRHAQQHGAAFNNALFIDGDVTGGMTLGDHVTERDYHLGRSEEESILAPWTFGNIVEFAGGAIRLSTADPIESKSILFTDIPFDASLTYNPGTGRIQLNRTLWAPIVTAGDGLFEDVNVQGVLSGRHNGVRSGLLEGFQSLEGIAHDDLLARRKAEDILAPWDFLEPVSVLVSNSSDDLREDGLAVQYHASMSGTGALDDRQRAALRATLTADTTAIDGMERTMAAAIHGDATLTELSYHNTRGLAVGVYGIARSHRDSMIAAGIAGVADETPSGTPRAGVLGALSVDEATSAALLPAGSHAGVFLGDVFVRGAITHIAANATTATISLGDAVVWTSGGVAPAPSAASAIGPIAGISMQTASPGESLTIAVAGPAIAKVSSPVLAGQGLEWDGSGVVPATPGCRAFLGTALQDGASLALVHVVPGYNP